MHSLFLGSVSEVSCCVAVKLPPVGYFAPEINLYSHRCRILLLNCWEIQFEVTERYIVVFKFNVVSTLAWLLGIIVSGSLVASSAVLAQTDQASQAPFIGFRPFDGSAPAGVNPASPSNTQSPATRPTTIVPKQPASAYPYPASGRPTFGAVSNSQNNTAERASLGGRLPSVTTPTGGLNVASGPTAISSQTPGVTANVDPALWKRYQQEIQQQQAQQQYQQYQQWLAQQQQFLQQRQTSAVGFRTPQQPASASPTPASRAAQPTPATRPDTQISVARPTTPKLNEPVVQQVSSTATSNRDRSVARADYSSVAQKSTTNNSVARQATSAAKPQCCCVPQNCCVAVPVQTPVTPAPVFRPQTVNQAANQIPSLTPGAPGGFAGQAGSNFQFQPQGGFQFQPGLGVPQFNSTGATGNRNWFSNVVTGTGAYTPLLPIVSAQGARLGQGIIGQPTAYIDGQPVRNLLRYIFP